MRIGPVTLTLLALSAPARAVDMFGPAAKPCSDLETTLAMVECSAAQTKIWDERLNTAYAALLAKGDPSQRGPLRDAERQWIQYRDANCRYYGSGDGTIHQIQAAECRRAMTQDRAEELETAARP